MPNSTITLTEMDSSAYVVYIDQDRNRTIRHLTPEMRIILLTRGKRLWRHNDFGAGRPGRQAQYHLAEEDVEEFEQRA
jgi:hypothetical protein